MAEAPDLDTYRKGVEELGKEITCPVCREHFREPKILPCLHYYCKECVQQLARHQHPFPCPECRTSIVLPQSGPDQLPTAFFVNRMIELYTIMEKAEGKVEVVCEMCSGAKAKVFCRHCTDFICSDCVTSHRKMKVFTGHQVVTLEELKVGGAKQIPPKEAPPVLCKDHDEQLKIFCFDCNRLICRDCIIDDHAGHQREFVKRFVPQCRDMLTESLAPLKKAQSDFRDASKATEATEAEVLAQCASVSNTIQQSFNRMIELLMQRKQQLLKDAAKLKDDKMDALRTQRSNFQVAQTEAQSLVEFVERSLENATDEELVSIHKQVLTRVEEGCKRCRQLDLKPTTEPNLAVDVSYGDSIPLNVGRVYSQYVATVQGAGIHTGEIGQPALFTVCIATGQGQPYSSHKVEAELQSLVDGALVRVKCVEKDRGIYDATYTPKNRGRHTLCVSVNGREIVGSPFQLFVKIHPTQLGKPVRTISGINAHVIAFNSTSQEILVRNLERNCVTVMNKCGDEIRTIAHNDIKHPHGVAVDKDENVYVTTDSLLKFNREGKLVQTLHGLKKPGFVAATASRVFVSEDGGNRIQILDPNLRIIRHFGQTGSGNGQFNGPRDIVQVGAKLFVADRNNDRIQVFDLEGCFVCEFGKKGSASETVQCPVGLCYDSPELLYVTERRGNCVSVFRQGGQFVASFGELEQPTGVAIDDDGFLYVCAKEGIVVL